MIPSFFEMMMMMMMMIRDDDDDDDDSRWKTERRENRFLWALYVVRPPIYWSLVFGSFIVVVLVVLFSSAGGSSAESAPLPRVDHGASGLRFHELCVSRALAVNATSTPCWSKRTRGNRHLQ
jgi:hypothetical protein